MVSLGLEGTDFNIANSASYSGARGGRPPAQYGSRVLNVGNDFMEVDEPASATDDWKPVISYYGDEPPGPVIPSSTQSTQPTGGTPAASKASGLLHQASSPGNMVQPGRGTVAAPMPHGLPARPTFQPPAPPTPALNQGRPGFVRDSPMGGTFTNTSMGECAS